MFAHGVEKIFHHPGICGHLNAAHPASVFFEQGGQPRKIYSVQAFLAGLFTPECRLLRKVKAPEGVRACLFDRLGRKVLALWSLRDGQVEVGGIEGLPSGLGSFPCLVLSRSSMGEAEFLGAFSTRRRSGGGLIQWP